MIRQKHKYYNKISWNKDFDVSGSRDVLSNIITLNYKLNKIEVQLLNCDWDLSSKPLDTHEHSIFV